MTEDKYLRFKCPKCKCYGYKLVSLTDDGKGKKYCRDCKRDIKKTYPKRNYSTIKKYEKSIENKKRVKKC